MVKQHVLRRGEGGLRFLSGARVQLVFGDEAELFNEVLFPDSLLNQLLQLLSDTETDIMGDITLTSPTLSSTKTVFM